MEIRIVLINTNLNLTTQLGENSMKYKKQAIADEQPSMNVEGVPAWLGDTFVCDGDKDKTICAGFFHLKHGDPLVYTYDYEEMKVIVDGEFMITDDSGQTVHATKGDVLYFASGDTIKFETPTFGIGFFTGQRPPI